jgi:hypothetical protein
MGVELGKVLAKAILAQLETPEDVKGHDSSVRPVTQFLPSNSPFLATLVPLDDGAHPLLSEE